MIIFCFNYTSLIITSNIRIFFLKYDVRQIIDPYRFNIMKRRCRRYYNIGCLYVRVCMCILVFILLYNKYNLYNYLFCRQVFYIVFIAESAHGQRI